MIDLTKSDFDILFEFLPTFEQAIDEESRTVDFERRIENVIFLTVQIAKLEYELGEKSKEGLQEILNKVKTFMGGFEKFKTWRKDYFYKTKNMIRRLTNAYN